MLSAKAKSVMLKLARDTVAAVVNGKETPDWSQRVGEFNGLALKTGGVFVTLRYRKMLRGCIGMMECSESLGEVIVQMSGAAACSDPRFCRVSPEEVEDITIEISVLSPLERVHHTGDIRLGVHGVLVRQGSKSGVFLPQVATETGWDKETFLSELCAGKAGLAPRAWQDPQTELYRFTAEVFGEEQ